MEETQVLIIGGGPSGLVLGLALARYNIQSIILEKERVITEDPRGVVLIGDAVRIVYNLGIGDQMSEISNPLQKLNFHISDFKNAPFLTVDTSRDDLGQVVPQTLSHIQPGLEEALCSQIAQSKYCALRRGCTVAAAEIMPTGDGVVVGYTTTDAPGGSSRLHHIRASYLVGADGKRGVVRKHFLEPAAGIQQAPGLSAYTGTWMAANLRIRLPTAETHPNFPLWALRFDPERVYDLFWPPEWHFCCPPGRPTACGRFGPHSARLWRHEFEERDATNDGPKGDDEARFWAHITPMITRDADEFGDVFPCGPVTFPKDCIDVLRCRPFTFSQKVVDRWFHGRTILIGDAAHVFPPFAGQGIACGVRDGYGLAWRLAMLLRLAHTSESLQERTLAAWALERRQGVDDSTRMTMLNGELVSQEPSSSQTSGLSQPMTLRADIERAGYKATKEGFYLRQFGGGGKVAQIYFRRAKEVALSDGVLHHALTAMSLLVIDSAPQAAAEESNLLTTLFSRVGIDSAVISAESIVFLCSQPQAGIAQQRGAKVWTPVAAASEPDNVEIPDGYTEAEYFSRLERGKKYFIVRPDFIIFATAADLAELERCMQLLKASVAASRNEEVGAKRGKRPLL